MKDRKLSEHLERSVARVGYYLAGTAGLLVPAGHWQKQFKADLERMERDGIDPDLRRRVNHYNRLVQRDGSFDGTPIRSVPGDRSRYYLDFMEVARSFPRHLEVDYSFYDRTTVPEVPGLVKARPIRGENENSVLIQLDRFRFFTYPADKRAFEDKKSGVIWRGLAGNNVVRQALCRRFAGHGTIDVGSTGALDDIPAVPFMSIRDQLEYRYILALEGNELISSLLWTLASNSVCIAAPFNFESWFMESLLEDGVHYVQIAADGSDLEEKVEALESDPAYARSLIRNAHAWVRQFDDRQRERLIGRLVLQKYFERTGQLEPTPLSAELFE